MSHKRARDENKTDIIPHNLAFVSKCLAIVLAPFSDFNETVVDSINGNVTQLSEVRVSSTGYNGKRLLHDFKIKNKTCYWNPSLVESIKSLEYKGFVEPCTVLVTGRDIHLENLRSAWGRRVLKAPDGFVIERIGDVNGIQMQVIPQTQFMPLPDALCSIVLDLNVGRVVATLEVVLEKLSLWYRDMTAPSQQLVIDTIGALIKERKVFHTGSGYFVVTPDTSKLQNSINASYISTNASWLPYHPMYVPVFQGELPQLSSRTHMRSISCQVTTIEESSEEEDNADRKKDKDGGRKACTVWPSAQHKNTCHVSGREGKCSKEVKGDNCTDATDGEFKRPSLNKVKGEKVKGAKVMKLKTANGNTEKVKGEKTSLFSKLFSRKRKDKDKDTILMPPPPPPPPPSISLVSMSAMTTTSNLEVLSEGKGDKEYATFSAQFPPPEWLWYQQQLDKHKRTEYWVTHISTANATPAPQIAARPPKGSKSQTANENLKHFSRASLNNLNHLDYVPMTAGNSLEDKYAAPKVQKQDSDHEFLKPLPVKPENIYESFSNASSVRHHRQHKDGNRKHLQRFSEYSVVDPSDTISFNNSSVYQSVLTLSPVANLQDRSTIVKLLQQPQLGPYHSTPVCGGPHDRTTYRVDGHEARDRIYGPPDIQQRSHRSRGRQQRTYSYYGSDISYEYKGSLPKKNSAQAQSRDSGVNCVGLGLPSDQAKKTTDPVYENTNKCHERRRSSHRHKKHSASSQLPSSHVHFDDNHETDNESTNLNLPSILDYTTPSVAYQSNITNTAYNSVVYGSTTDMVGASSLMCQTITSSFLESSEIPFVHTSLQSGFYDESNIGLPARFAASGQIISKGYQDLVELHSSSPETVIVDVVGSLSESEGYDLCEGLIDPVTGEGSREAAVSMEDNAQVAQWRCEQKQVDTAEVCNESGDDAGEGDCHRGLVKKQKGGGIDSTAHFRFSKSAEVVLPQPVDAPIHRRQDVVGEKNKCVTDSGFSSPMNAGVTGEMASSSNQSNSSTDNSGGTNEQENNHQVCNSPVSSGNGSSGHQGSSDISMATGSEHQSKSSSDNVNLCNGAFLQRQGCGQKPTSNIQQGSSQNSLLSNSDFQQSKPPHQNSVLHNHPAIKHMPHHVIYDNSNTVHKDFTLPARVPLHTSAIVNVHRPHRTDKPNSVNSSKPNMPNDSRKCEGKQLSKKSGFGEEFHVMGVL